MVEKLMNDLNNLQTCKRNLLNEYQVLVYGGYLRGEVEMDFHSVLNAVDDAILKTEAALHNHGLTNKSWKG